MELCWASLVAQLVKNLPVVQETRVRSLGWEDPLEKEMATHSSILAWKISWTEEPGGLQSMGSQRVRHDWVTNTLRILYVYPGYKGDTNPFSDMWFANVFSYSVDSLFTFLRMSFEAQMFLVLMMSAVAIFFLLSLVLFVSYVRKHCLISDHKDFLLYILLGVL